MGLARGAIQARRAQIREAIYGLFTEAAEAGEAEALRAAEDAAEKAADLADAAEADADAKEGGLGSLLEKTAARAAAKTMRERATELASRAAEKDGYFPDPSNYYIDADWVAFSLLGMPLSTVVHTLTRPLAPQKRADYMRTVEEVKEVFAEMRGQGLVGDFPVSFSNQAKNQVVHNPPTLFHLTWNGAVEVLERKARSLAAAEHAAAAEVAPAAEA